MRSCVLLLYRAFVRMYMIYVDLCLAFVHMYVLRLFVCRPYMCNELGGNMARFTQFPIMITRSTIIYEIVSPGAAGSSIYV